MTVEVAEGGQTKLSVEISYTPPLKFGNRALDRPIIKPYVRKHVDRSLASLREIFGRD